MPLLDILQSVPILGFLSVTVVWFLSLSPGRILGAELACVFAIFTGQAWNMAFSFYQSLRTVPEELEEAGRMFGLNAWARFWRIEAPFATPSLIWNMMMSMSGGWFFVTVAEAISVGKTNIALPGIGSWIAVAIAQQNLPAIFEAIGAMMVVILIYDQLLFRPLVAWADRFRVSSEPSEEAPQSWALTIYRRSRLLDLMTAPFQQMMRWSYYWHPPSFGLKAAVREVDSRVVRHHLVCAAGGAGRLCRLAHLASSSSMPISAGTMRRPLSAMGFITLIRVMVLIALASAIWTPIGIYVGLRPKLTAIVQPVAQFLAAFPNNLLFPLVVSLIVFWNASPDIWLSPLIILGTQWYILFNVIAGASTMPQELRDAAENFGVRGWLWWKKGRPARGISLLCHRRDHRLRRRLEREHRWRKSQVGASTTLHAHGLGAYIADAVNAGDFHRVVLGIDRDELLCGGGEPDICGVRFTGTPNANSA